MILEGSIRIPFTYAAGETASTFLCALRDEQRILAARCEACSRTRCPPQPFCAGCGQAPATLVPVGPGGTVRTWTRVPGKGVFGLILLDGADTPLLHRLLGPEGGWADGDRVVARFAADRSAHINDIEGFEKGP